MYFIGCASIYLMAAISIERYYIIYQPLNLRTISFQTNLSVILVCILNGLFWAAMPLLGWSHYALEGAHTSCSVEWGERSMNVQSYNVAMFGFVYLIPVCVILFTNIRLIVMVRLK
jgi:hypothetical protein